MKATIQKDGTLVVTAETGIEEFALYKWLENFHGGNESSMLLIEPNQKEHNQ